MSQFADIHTTLHDKYMEFANIFSLDLVTQILKYTEINNYTITLIGNQQSFYRLIFSSILVKREIIKIYISTHSENNFIRAFESST